jgi:hypothetical protein
MESGSHCASAPIVGCAVSLLSGCGRATGAARGAVAPVCHAYPVERALLAAKLTPSGGSVSRSNADGARSLRRTARTPDGTPIDRRPVPRSTVAPCGPGGKSSRGFDPCPLRRRLGAHVQCTVCSTYRGSPGNERSSRHDPASSSSAAPRGGDLCSHCSEATEARACRGAFKDSGAHSRCRRKSQRDRSGVHPQQAGEPHRQVRRLDRASQCAHQGREWASRWDGSAVPKHGRPERPAQCGVRTHRFFAGRRSERCIGWSRKSGAKCPAATTHEAAQANLLICTLQPVRHQNA